MIKIEAIIRPDKVEEIVDALDELGHSGITKSEVEGHGKQKGIVEQFRGKEYRLSFIPKVKIELVVKDSQAESIIKLITSIAYSGQIGDGKIFISEIIFFNNSLSFFNAREKLV